MRLSSSIAAALALAACGSGTSSSAYDGAYGAPYDADAGEGAPADVQAPTVLVSGLGAPIGIALIGGTVYAADPVTGVVVSVSASGGAVTTLASGLGAPTWLATDGTQLFVSDAAGGRLLAISTSGTVAALATGLGTPGRIAVANGIVYWLDEGTPEAGGAVTDGTGALLSIAASGGTATTIAADLNTPHDLLVVGDQVLFTEVGPPANCSTGANWQQIQSESRIAVVSTAPGSKPATFAQQPPPFVTVQGGYLTPTGAGQARGLAVDPSGTYLFFTTRGICWPVAGNVYETTVAPGTNLTTLSYAPPSSGRIDASATMLTWASQALLSQVPWGGSAAPYTNLSSQTSPGDFVWSGSTVYWTDEEEGTVLSLTPGS